MKQNPKDTKNKAVKLRAISVPIHLPFTLMKHIQITELQVHLELVPEAQVWQMVKYTFAHKHNSTQ